MCPNPLDLILTFLSCSPPSTFPMHDFLRILDSFVSSDTNVVFDLEDNLFDMLKGTVIDDN